MIKHTLLILLVVGCGDVVTDPGDNPCPEGAVCECTVATETDDCGAHAICEESGDNRQCACVALYEDAGSGCAFVGGPNDPGFQDANAWTVAGSGMVVDGAAGGIEQPGELTINKLGSCSFATASQSVTMPPYNRADALKVTMTYHVSDPFIPPGFNQEFPFNMAMQISVGGQFIEFPMVKESIQKRSFCLGEAAFGGPVDIKFGVVTKAADCVTPPGQAIIRVDEFKLEVAELGECPTQPGVINGNFQLATGWLFPSIQSGTGQIVADIGENGTFGARLTQPNRCSELSARGTISIPSDLEHPALDVYWNGTSGARLAVKLNGKGVGTLNANGELKHSRLCLPKWAVGNIAALDLFAQRNANNACTTALNRTFILDNMTVVDEPSCGPLADIPDPGFEFVVDPEGPMPAWSLTNGYVNDLEGARSIILNQQTQANTGSGVLRTSNNNFCVSSEADGPGAEVAFVVPAPAGAAGPALKFMAKAANNPNTETRAQFVPETTAFFTVPETNAFVPGTLCLPPSMAGRLMAARFLTRNVTGGGCAQAVAEEFGFFDDVQVTTDAACPAQ